MATDWKNILTELADVALPVSCAFAVGRTTYVDYCKRPLEQRRGRRYPLATVRGKTGGFVLGESTVGVGRVSDDGGEFRIETPPSKLRSTLPEASVRVVASAGRTWLHPKQVRLDIGQIVLLDHKADEPVPVYFPNTGRVWMRGEVVTVDDSYGVRLLGRDGESRAKPERPDMLEVEVTIGEAVFDLEDYAAVGEGTICRLNSSCLDPLVLRCGSEPLGYGYLSVDDRNGRFQFVVTDLPEGGRAVRSEAGDTSAETGSAEVDILDLLPVYPPTERNAVLSQQRPGVAGWFVKCLGYQDADAAAELVTTFCRDASDGQLAEFAGGFVSSDPRSVSSSVRRGLAEHLLRRLPAGDASELRTRLGNADGESGGFDSSSADPVELAAMVISRVPEALAALVIESSAAGEVLRRLCPLTTDMSALSDRDVQTVLREIDLQDLARAYVDADESIKTALKRNMSDRAAGMLDEEFSFAARAASAAKARSRTTVRRVLESLARQGEIEL